MISTQSTELSNYFFVKWQPVCPGLMPIGVRYGRMMKHEKSRGFSSVGAAVRVSGNKRTGDGMQVNRCLFIQVEHGVFLIGNLFCYAR